MSLYDRIFLTEGKGVRRALRRDLSRQKIANQLIGKGWGRKDAEHMAAVAHASRAGVAPSLVGLPPGHRLHEPSKQVVNYMFTKEGDLPSPGGRTSSSQAEREYPHGSYFRDRRRSF